MAHSVDVDKLPLLNIAHDIDVKELYTIIRGYTCRRCTGSGIDPDGEYPCLLCHGDKIEKWKTGSIMVCSGHPNRELVYIGKRKANWEDAMGFDRSGHVGVRGYPICMKPVYSVKVF